VSQVLGLVNFESLLNLELKSNDPQSAFQMIGYKVYSPTLKLFE